MFSRAQSDVVTVEPEVHLVAWLDPKLVSQRLGDNDLPFGADTTSHTDKYNSRERLRDRRQQGRSTGHRGSTPTPSKFDDVSVG